MLPPGWTKQNPIQPHLERCLALFSCRRIAILMGLPWRSVKNDHEGMRALAILLALSSAGCNIFGPSKTVDGEWTGSLGKFSFVCMTLQQDGDAITGIASAVSDTFLLYKGVPVRGDHPGVSFTVGPLNVETCCQHMVGIAFTGKQDSTEDIVGRYGSVDIRFERDDRNQCGNARVVP